MQPFRRAALYAAPLLLALTAHAAPIAAKKTLPKPAPAPIVRIQTDKGVILIKLFPKDAPLTVANFEKLVAQGFYNGITFHRVDDLEGPGKGHIIQGGSPTSRTLPPDDPTIGNGGPGYTIKGEFPENGVPNPLKHKAGAVAMARANDPNSGGSQFYIVVTPTPDLDGKYAVFGQVIKGLDVAAKVQQGDKMTKVTLTK